MDTEPEAPAPPETATRDVPPPPPGEAAAGPAPAQVPSAPHALSPTEDIPPVIERAAPTPTGTVDMPPVEETAPASVEVELPPSLDAARLRLFEDAAANVARPEERDGEHRRDDDPQKDTKDVGPAPLSRARRGGLRRRRGGAGLGG